MMSIQGQILEVTVVSCHNLKNTEWISKQDPYVCLDYSGTKHRTQTCKDGGRNPTFQEKFMITLIEGQRDIAVTVWNSNTMTADDFIGSATVPMHKVLAQGFDDCSWTLQTKTGRHGGEVRFVMHYAGAAQHNYASGPPVQPYGHHVPMYSAPPQPMPPAMDPSTLTSSLLPYSGTPQNPMYPSPAYPPPSGYPHQPSAYPPPCTSYPPSPYPPTHGAPFPPPGQYPPPPPPY